MFDWSFMINRIALVKVFTIMLSNANGRHGIREVAIAFGLNNLRSWAGAEARGHTGS